MQNDHTFEFQHLDHLGEQYPILIEPYIKDKLQSEIEEGNTRICSWLKSENPFKDDSQALRKAQLQLGLGDTAVKAIENDFTHYRLFAKHRNVNIDEKFWLSEIQIIKKGPEGEPAPEKRHIKPTSKKSAKASSKKNIKSLPKRISKKKKIQMAEENRLICRTLLQTQWEKLLDQQQTEWELEKIEEYRRKILKDIKEWLDLIQKLGHAFANLSIEPWLLFDLSKGNLSLSDIDQLRRWVTYIAEDKGVKELCELMGRLYRAEKTSRQELVRQISRVKEYVPDINSKEEIVGIHLGRDLEHILPQELALLADQGTSRLFDMKLADGRLMCFDMEGVQPEYKKSEKETAIEQENQEALGPIIICIDTSGSMQGATETIAKAVTLFMATRAISQKRNCSLINFSTSIETLDLAENGGILNLIQFLQRSFHGGTDVSPALEYALELMETERYRNSDLLIISDFIMASLPIPIQDQINRVKQNKNMFYSLSIGDLF